MNEKKLKHLMKNRWQPRFMAIPAAGPWLIEIAPLAAVLAVLWAKLVYLSCLLPSQWWSLDESMKEWMQPVAYVFRAVARHPHVLSATLASLLLMAAVFPILRRTSRFLLLLAINLFLTTVALADIVHIRFYADVLSASDLVMAPALTGVLASIAKQLRPTDALYYLDVMLVAAAMPYYVRACKRTASLALAHRAQISVALALSGLAVAAPTAWVVWRHNPDLFSYTTVRIEAASTIGILPYHFLDAVVHLAKTEAIVDAAGAERVRRYFSKRHEHKASTSELAGVARGRNVIVISAESLQAFPLGLEVNGAPVMPRLSAFARESLQFVNFYDQTYLGTTSDAEFMVMQSLHPLPAGVLASQYHHHAFRGLPKVLGEHGYTTLSMCAAPSNFWHMDQMHPGLGFQKSYFDESYQGVERINHWLPDGEFFSQSVDLLKKQREPFMAFLLSSSNHHPYAVPAAYKKLDIGKLEGTLLGDYLHSVHYFDRAFGEFIDKLRNVGLFDSSVILLYGDHQGFLGDPPELLSLLGFSRLDEFRTTQTRKNVPLLIRLPHGKHASVRATPAGHVDIAPTLLSLLGLRDDKNVALGSDLTGTADPLVVFRDGSFVAAPGYFMKRFGLVSGGTCYDLKAGRQIDCAPLEGLRAAAMERLEISDLIVRGDLIPALTGGGGQVASAPPRRVELRASDGRDPTRLAEK